jgi:hypothetical protein
VADLSDVQSAQSVKLIGTDSTGLESNPVGADSNGNLQATIIQNELVSTNNSSTANLASSATFTGTSDTIIGYGSVAINFKSDQNVTIQMQQSSDGTNWDFVDSYSVTANTGDRRVFRALSKFCRVLVTNNGGSTTTFLRLQVIYSPIPNEAAQITQNRDLTVSDGIRNGGVYGNLALTTGGTTYEAKVGGSRLANRKLLSITALDDMYWGYDSSVTTSTGTPLVKNQQIIFSADPNSTFQVWLVASANSKNARITEAP